MFQFKENSPFSISLENIKLIESFDGPPQKFQILEHSHLGYALVINGELQHVYKWSHFYHEQLVHLPACYLNSFQSALILGGGSLFVAHEILKHKSVERVVMVDHDETLIRTIEKYYPHARAVVNDPRFELLVRDATPSNLKTIGKFDLIVNDCFDLSSINIDQENNVVDDLIYLLNEGGLCTDTVYRSIYDGLESKKIIGKIKEVSSHLFCGIIIQEYPGIFHIHCIFGKNENIKTGNTTNAIYFSDELFYFDPEYIKSFTRLPRYMQNFVASA